MGFEFFIARRYLKSKKRERFISLLTFLSIGGVALGVAVVIFVNSMMNGFETEVKSRIGGTISHITVYGYNNSGIKDYDELIEKIEATSGIVGAMPLVVGKGAVGSEYETDGVIIRGVEPHSLDRVSSLRENMIRGKFEFRSAGKLPGAVLGSGLARRLKVGLKDTVFTASLKGRSLSIGMSDIKITRFVVNGVFETGMYDYDDHFIFVSIPEAQKIFKLKDEYRRSNSKLLAFANPLFEPLANHYLKPADKLKPADPVTAIQVKVTDPAQVIRISERLDQKIGMFYAVRNWVESHANLFYWMKWEKILLTLALLLIVAVATFNIISTLVMVVQEKQPEIAILKTIGANPGSIVKIFMSIGLISGLSGTAFGAVIGYLMCWVQSTFRIIALPGDIYFLSFLPIEMRLVDFVTICVSAVLLSFLATLYPAFRAGRLYPLEIIRYQ